uniref:NAD(P)H-quinone oxidoreductase subunit 5, chloroplastic n=1 Tax=Convolvulus arvensis TaxID=4123 RepID=A0A7S8HPR7_CONAR|nr:NADH-plastoquinone oxidoreductase subunit 5 [Convolvulus arvensis]QPC56344.1 NADH-plastoquinone oxidoreductase subunit 5 [Convolvulus arvensis]
MEQTYQYAWIIPFVPLQVPILIGAGLLLFPTVTKNIRRMWSFQSVLFLSIVMAFSIYLSIQQINRGSIYQYVWSWIINNDFSFEFGYLIDPLTSIMSILITTVGIMVLIYSDNYMAHDQGYLRFFAYMSFFCAAMLGLVTSSNFIQIYIFWELVGLCSYLLIGFWFTRPGAANACEKAFVTNRVGDFGLLLGILGFYWITGSFEFRELFQILNNLISSKEVNFLFVTLCAALLFVGAIAKSAQFPLHVWLPDAMEGPTPISALIHAATLVAAGIFLVARLLPLFLVIPSIMYLISLIGIITVLLGATLALAQQDIKRGLAYSTMSQLGYMMLALGMGSYRSALFHLITHAYSKALLFLAAGSVIHSMETIIGYSPDKSQNMVLMGGLTKYVPITKSAFLLGTLSLCGIPPLACFWSKDEILNDSWLYSPIFALIAWGTVGLTAFYMFRIYLMTFEGHLSVGFQNYSGKKKNPPDSISLWGKKGSKPINKNFRFLTIDEKGENKTKFSYTSDPFESENTMLFPKIILCFVTFVIGFLGIPKELGFNLDILTQWLNPAIYLLHHTDSTDLAEFLKNTVISVGIAYCGIFIAFLLYKPTYSSFNSFLLINSFHQKSLKRVIRDKIGFVIYDWAYNRAYIDTFYNNFFVFQVRRFSQIIRFFDLKMIDQIFNSFAFFSFIVSEGIKYLGYARIPFYLFFYFFFVSIFIFLFYKT